MMNNFTGVYSLSSCVHRTHAGTLCLFTFYMDTHINTPNVVTFHRCIFIIIMCTPHRTHAGTLGVFTFHSLLYLVFTHTDTHGVFTVQGGVSFHLKGNRTDTNSSVTFHMIYCKTYTYRYTK